MSNSLIMLINTVDLIIFCTSRRSYYCGNLLQQLTNTTGWVKWGAAAHARSENNFKSSELVREKTIRSNCLDWKLRFAQFSC